MQVSRKKLHHHSLMSLNFPKEKPKFIDSTPTIDVSLKGGEKNKVSKQDMKVAPIYFHHDETSCILSGN